MKKLLYSVMMLAFSCGIVSAQKPAVVANDKTGWHKIGETTVDFEKDVDEVAVLLADRFAMLKFKVTEAPIELLDLDVYYEEGDMQNIKIGYAIKEAGSESKPIDLKGGAERNLKKITFRYKSIENRSDKKARVEIWGKKTNVDKAANKKGQMKKEANATKNEAKKDVKQGSKEVKKETKEAKKEAREESRELKKEAKETKKEVEKEIND